MHSHSGRMAGLLIKGQHFEFIQQPWLACNMRVFYWTRLANRVGSQSQKLSDKQITLHPTWSIEKKARGMAKTVMCCPKIVCFEIN